MILLYVKQIYNIVCVHTPPHLKEKFQQAQCRVATETTISINNNPHQPAVATILINRPRLLSSSTGRYTILIGQAEKPLVYRYV